MPDMKHVLTINQGELPDHVWGACSCGKELKPVWFRDKLHYARHIAEVEAKKAHRIKSDKIDDTLTCSCGEDFGDPNDKEDRAEARDHVEDEINKSAERGARTS